MADDEAREYKDLEWFIKWAKIKCTDRGEGKSATFDEEVSFITKTVYAAIRNGEVPGVVIENKQKWGNDMPAHMSFGSDCTGLFTVKKGAALVCNECGIHISAAIYPYLKKLHEGQAR